MNAAKFTARCARRNMARNRQRPRRENPPGPFCALRGKATRRGAVTLAAEM